MKRQEPWKGAKLELQKQENGEQFLSSSQGLKVSSYCLVHTLSSTEKRRAVFWRMAFPSSLFPQDLFGNQGWKSLLSENSVNQGHIPFPTIYEKEINLMDARRWSLDMEVYWKISVCFIRWQSSGITCPYPVARLVCHNFTLGRLAVAFRGRWLREVTVLSTKHHLQSYWRNYISWSSITPHTLPEAHTLIIFVFSGNIARPAAFWDFTDRATPDGRGFCQRTATFS